VRIINFYPWSKDMELLRLNTESDDRLEAFKAQKLLDLVHYLHDQGPEPQIYCHLYIMVLRLSLFVPGKRGLIKVWIDWQDYGVVQDGLPEAYYRLQIMRGKSHLSEDARVKSPKEVEGIICEAFGWSR
jgi:hypothetical protein